MDPTDELFVCTISGRCFDRLLSAAEMEPDAVISLSLFIFCVAFYHFFKVVTVSSIVMKLQEQQQVGATDEAEPFMGSGRFGMNYIFVV